MVERTGVVAATTAPRPIAPRVWCLAGEKRGDNQQVFALAQALEEPYAVKQLRYAPTSRVPNLLRRACPLGISVDAGTPIAPPWPELVLAVGKRSVPLALSIRAASGGRSRLVQIGRPSAPIDWFDLILTTPQYRLPPAPNVLEMPLPLSNTSAESVAESARASDDLPRPLIAVLIGGPTKELRFGVDEAIGLARRALERAAAAGGTVVAITSPRTPEEVAAAMRSLLVAPHRVYVWQADAPNPYAALLASAEYVLVTADSVSMLADACRSAAAVEVVPLPEVAGRWLRLERWAYAWVGPHLQRDRLFSRLVVLPLTSGLWRLPRQCDALHEALARRGLLGAEACSPPARHAAIHEWEHSAVERVRALLLTA